jgi:hypothetical protein
MNKEKCIVCGKPMGNSLHKMPVAYPPTTGNDEWYEIEKPCHKKCDIEE